MSRKVFDLPLMPGYVVKVEEDPHRFQNILEWEAWNTVSYCKEAQWFAPCKAISPNGRVLVMAKTEPAQLSQYPARIPTFFTDLKYANFGLLNGRLVCHDYGTSLLMTVGINKRLKKADWYAD